MKLDYPATQRNKDAILGVLLDALPARGLVLEVAAGSGQHAAHFAAALPRLTWQPSSPDPGERASIEAYRAESGLANLRRPLDLDVRREPWPVESADAIFNANMMHIAPWSASLSLFAGAGRLLPSGGVLVTYGPYAFDGRFTAESNSRFDASLRQRDPEWGIRDVVELDRVAAEVGLAREQTVAMPANNHTLVWRRI